MGKIFILVAATAIVSNNKVSFMCILTYLIYSYVIYDIYMLCAM